MTKLASFLYKLKSFAKRSDHVSAPARHRDRNHDDNNLNDPQSPTTASLFDDRDIYNAVLLVSSHRFIGHVPLDLLTRVMAVLRVRVRLAVKQISAFDQLDGSPHNKSIIR